MFHVSAQVMLTSNINIEERLVNGLIGKVMGIAHEHGAVRIVHVKFNEENAWLVTMRSDIIAQQPCWVAIHKHEASFPKKKINHILPKQELISISFVLGMYNTKVQGLCLKEGVVSFELQRKMNFNQGQMYVALSRISKFENMNFAGKYHRNAIKTNQNVTKEYKRLYNEGLLLPPLLQETSSDALNSALLNTR